MSKLSNTTDFAYPRLLRDPDKWEADFLPPPTGSVAGHRRDCRDLQVGKQGQVIPPHVPLQVGRIFKKIIGV